MNSSSGSTPAEAKAFLDAHPEIEAFDIVLTDANGIGRGKIIRRHELEPLYRNGRHMPISILGLDITGEDVHETGLIWDSGDGDLRAWPIPGTLAPLYGTHPPRGQVLMAMHHLDGRPMSSDPRHALARQVEALAAKGLHPAGAFELEFFLLANERDADGKVQPATAVLDGRRSGKTEVYSVAHLHGMEPLFSDIYAAAKAQGVPRQRRIEVLLNNRGPKDALCRVSNAYGDEPARQIKVAAGGSERVVFDLAGSAGWYDVTVTTPDAPRYLRRFAGHHEDGRPATSDPGVSSHGLVDPRNELGPRREGFGGGGLVGNLLVQG